MNLEPAKRQAQAAQIAADCGCYLLAECFTENAKEALVKAAAEEVAKRAVEMILPELLNGNRKPEGLVPAKLFAAMGGVLSPKQHVVGENGPELFIPGTSPVCTCLDDEDQDGNRFTDWDEECPIHGTIKVKP